MSNLMTEQADTAVEQAAKTASSSSSATSDNKDKKDIDIAEYTRQFESFSGEFDTIHLASVSKDSVPEASYAPYLKVNGDFYVYVSELSKHTANMMHHNKVSILLIESEADAKHLFARKRLTYSATVTEVARNTEEFDLCLDGFEEKFGKFMGMLRNLHDFHLFKLTPEAGNFVAGFARAFYLRGDGLDQLEHVNDVGHAAADRKTEKQMEQTV